MALTYRQGLIIFSYLTHRSSFSTIHCFRRLLCGHRACLSRTLHRYVKLQCIQYQIHSEIATPESRFLQETHLPEFPGHSVDLQDIFIIKHFISRKRAGMPVTAHFRKSPELIFTNSEFLYADRHVELPVVIFLSADSLKRRLFRMLKIFLHAPDVDSKADKSRKIVCIDITSPAAP